MQPRSLKENMESYYHCTKSNLGDHLAQRLMGSMLSRKVKWFDQGHPARGWAEARPSLQLPEQCSFNHSRLPFELSHGN